MHKVRAVIEGLALERPPPPSRIHLQASTKIAGTTGEPLPRYGTVHDLVREGPGGLLTLAHRGGKVYNEVYDQVHRREAARSNAIWQADRSVAKFRCPREDGLNPKPTMSEFKRRHFEGEIILWAMRWYCRCGISYRHLEQMMGERGVGVDHSMIYRWVQKYAPEIEKRLRWQWRCPRSPSWRVDGTYMKVRGKWTYLYRALDKEGNTIDFYLSATRNAKAAKRFLGTALNGLKDWEKPKVINTDKAPTYGIAISELKTEGKCPEETADRQVKYLNNVVEADHGKLKQLIRPVRGFKTFKTAYATIVGFEVVRALRKAQAAIFNLTHDSRGEERIVERPFGIGASALADPVAVIGNNSNSKRLDARMEPGLRDAPSIPIFATEPRIDRQTGNRRRCNTVADGDLSWSMLYLQLICSTDVELSREVLYKRDG